VVAGKLRFPSSQPQKRHIPRTLSDIRVNQKIYKNISLNLVVFSISLEI
jgi:hypothetical protein